MDRSVSQSDRVMTTTPPYIRQALRCPSTDMYNVNVALRVCRISEMVMQMQSVDLKQNDHHCVNTDGATVFNIISEISLYLDSFLQVE